MEYIDDAEGETSLQRQWCVVYDADTTRILHIQEYIAITDAETDDKQKLEAIALENATRHFPRSRLGVLHPATTDLDPASVASIDPQSMTLRSVDGFISNLRSTSSDQ